MKEILEASAGDELPLELDTGLEFAEKKRFRRSSRTKKILYNSVMLLVTFGNQIAAQVDPIEKAEPPTIAQIQTPSQVDQENLPDGIVTEAKGEETPLTPEEIAAQEVAEYPFRTEAPDVHNKLEEASLITLELKRPQDVDEEDQTEQAA